MEDTDYKADAEKSKLTVDYTSGEKVERVRRTDLFTPPIKKRLEFLFRKRPTS